ncbi:hypothetical protein Syun_007198 [Stephania yunnanensis]|uniref:Chlorophyllase n=1 Tax=Stephania yunnanensis TaxID=152371 RepID=A0AAP0KY09_9MAGN
MTDQELELELNEAGTRLGDPPNSVDDLLGILDGLMDRLKDLFFDALLCFLLKKWRSVNSPVQALLYDVAGADSTEEIKAAASVTEWLANGLQPELPTLVQPNLTKLGIAGHSRRGKAAFVLALDQHKMISHTSLKYSALMGIDPVDGMGKGSQTPPPVLTYVPHSFDVNMAAMVVGLGELRKNPLFPPCAPNGVNHRDFFDECCSPACHFGVKDYGHLDMLYDETRGLRGRATYCICKNGKAREPMRRFVEGLSLHS